MVQIQFNYPDIEVVQIQFNYPDIEVVQIQFNYLDYDDPAVQSRRCYEVCRKHIVMEPVKGPFEKSKA